MFAAAEALRPEMVMGECRLGSGGLEAVMVMFGGSACSMASQAEAVAPSTLAWCGLRERLSRNRVISSLRIDRFCSF